MVSKAEKKRMKEYIAGRFEDSGISIEKDISSNCLQLKKEGEKGAYVFLHTTPSGAEDFIHGDSGFHRLVYEGNFVTNIFYKDGKNFFVLLNDIKKGTLRNKSMKDYRYNTISRMVNLRLKEQEVLRLQGDKELVYYQPDNIEDGGRLEEGLVKFAFSKISPSYSHRKINEPGYDFIMADDGKPLVRRYISENKKVLDGSLKIKLSYRSPRIFTLDSVKKIPLIIPEKRSLREVESYFLEQTGTNLEDWGGDISDYIDPQ